MKDLSNENVIHIKKFYEKNTIEENKIEDNNVENKKVYNKSVEYLQFRRLLKYQDILEHAYILGVDKTYRTSRLPGNISKEEVENGMKNYQEFCDAIGRDARNIVLTLQNHTDNVMVVKEKERFNLEKQEVDGICTNTENNILATVNADCILLLFFDPIKRVIANSHSGWRGTLQRISVKTVNTMIEEYDCNPEDIICCICPSIRKCHFEVEKDVKDKFVTEFKDIENIDNFIEETVVDKKWNIDTVRINEILLKNCGLRSENIIDSGICSVCNCDIIHSYRAEGNGNGLSTAIIELKKAKF